MNILLSGYCGHMGKEIIALAKSGYNDAKITAGVDGYATGNEEIPCAKTFAEADTEADIIIDFSYHGLTKELLDFAVNNNIPLVLATTGQTEDEKNLIHQASKRIPLFFAANYSIGVATLISLAKKAAMALPNAEIEIVETHHDRKLDAPSGTALAIAEAIETVRTDAHHLCGRSGHGKREQSEIGISSIRIGNVAGIHEVIIGTQNETITLKHEAHNRSLFAEGALTAAKYILENKKNVPGLYTMTDMLG